MPLYRNLYCTFKEIIGRKQDHLNKQMVLPDVSLLTTDPLSLIQDRWLLQPKRKCNYGLICLLCKVRSE
ncbi:hypothetical protein TNCT_58461 [Trichonephila clavata]|uniref:Uncharacterized protein n=1 Tax=Trichonephila clavata TaxID=2740835 RepID=A0A8X6HF50_TRICU|nr:hypothetical protein TNCT_58461 [Trichonephila clavata]